MKLPDPKSLIERDFLQNNSIDRLATAEILIQSLQQQEIHADSLEEISDSAGVQQDYQFANGDIADPNLNGTVSVWPPVAFNGHRYDLYGARRGRPQWGANSEDGSLMHGGERGFLDEDGHRIEGSAPLGMLFHIVEAGKDSYTALGYHRVYSSPPYDPPILRLISWREKITEFLPYGSFETGDATGWTLSGSGGTLEITSDEAKDQVYSARLVIPPSKAAVLTSDMFSTESNMVYILRGSVKAVSGSGELVAAIYHYNVADSLITSFVADFTVFTGGEYPWSNFCRGKISPAAADHATAVCTLTNRGLDDLIVYLDSLSIKSCYDYNEVELGNMSGGPIWGGSYTDGQDQSANTAASFNSQVTTIKAGQDLRVSHVFWDLPYTGEYQLLLLNSQVITDVWKSLWYSPSAGGGEVDMALDESLIIHAGTTVYLGVKKVGAALKWGSKNVASYKGTDFLITGHWFDGSANAGYTPGVKLTYQIGKWA